MNVSYNISLSFPYTFRQIFHLYRCYPTYMLVKHCPGSELQRSVGILWITDKHFRCHFCFLFANYILIHLVIKLISLLKSARHFFISSPQLIIDPKYSIYYFCSNFYPYNLISIALNYFQFYLILGLSPCMHLLL